jgi:hypothetical protein
MSFYAISQLKYTLVCCGQFLQHSVVSDDALTLFVEVKKEKSGDCSWRITRRRKKAPLLHMLRSAFLSGAYKTLSSPTIGHDDDDDELERVGRNNESVNQKKAVSIMGKKKGKSTYVHNKTHNSSARESDERRLLQLRNMEVKRLQKNVERQEVLMTAYIPEHLQKRPRIGFNHMTDSHLQL